MSVSYTMLPDGSISVGPLTMTSQSTYTTADEITSRPGWQTYDPPEKCRKRKGGPRSKTFCEVFAELDHTIHMGRSKSGRWWSWNEK